MPGSGGPRGTRRDRPVVADRLLSFFSRDTCSPPPTPSARGLSVRVSRRFRLNLCLPGTGSVYFFRKKKRKEEFRVHVSGLRGPSSCCFVSSLPCKVSIWSRSDFWRCLRSWRGSPSESGLFFMSDSLLVKPSSPNEWVVVFHPGRTEIGHEAMETDLPLSFLPPPPGKPP